VDHKILLAKMKILGFNTTAINLFTSYLYYRQQVVLVDGSLSERLHTGPISVVQGSILSSILFLFYTMDLPLLFHNTKHDPVEELDCKQPSTSTYVNDWIVTIHQLLNRSMQQGIDMTMSKLLEYMTANRLIMNCDKTLLMIISKDKTKQKEAIIPNVNPELIVHPEPSMKILGTIVSNNLKWNSNISEHKEAIIPLIQKRIQMLRLLAKSAPTETLLKVANGIVISKILYGMET
jgi:hypothetical protein